MTDRRTVQIVIVTTQGTNLTKPYTADTATRKLDEVYRAARGPNIFEYVDTNHVPHSLNGRHIVEWYPRPVDD